MDRRRLQRRAKLLNAITFFVDNTKQCSFTKLSKLLFFLDFGIYRETGHTVTGLSYFAESTGPVPRSLLEEWKTPGIDVIASDLFSNDVFDSLEFTGRELDLLRKLAAMYADNAAEDMPEKVLLPNRPWHQVYEVRKQAHELIPYALALDDHPGSISAEQATLIEEEAYETAMFWGDLD